MNKYYFVISIALVAITPALAHAKPDASFFTVYGEAKDKGKQDGIDAFKAGLPDEPNCDLSSAIFCHPYTSAFHEGWKEAKDVAP